MSIPIKTIQTKIDKIFKTHFGYTPLNERLKDIQREFFELMKWSDVKNLKEEAGDLICSLIELHTENGWDLEENIKSTLEKIESRSMQYKSLGRKTKVAVYGGAYNMVTNGHIQVAQFLLNTTGEFDEVWMMPAYKHMYGKKMAEAEHRLEMGRLAARVDNRIKIFDYEIKNQLAGETYYFVKKLKEEKELTEQYHFSIVIGLDNANTFENWVNYELLERLIRFVVVPRRGYVSSHPNAWYFKEPHIYLSGENPVMEVSSSFVRKLFNEYYRTSDPEIETKILKCVDLEVYKYILKHNLYNE
jgi:nicotinate-nucleotide adenylyltransferase